jgi:hypothetical protein
MSSKRAKLKTPFRTCTLDVTEEPERIVFRLAFSLHGAFGDERQISEWMGKAMAPYYGDPRPFVMPDPLTGEVATVTGDETAADVQTTCPGRMN